MLIELRKVKLSYREKPLLQDDGAVYVNPDYISSVEPRDHKGSIYWCVTVGNAVQHCYNVGSVEVLVELNLFQRDMLRVHREGTHHEQT